MAFFSLVSALPLYGDGAVADVPAVGDVLPAFSLPTHKEDKLSWNPSGNSLREAEQTTNPDAMVLHFFQPDCNACQDQAKALEALR